MNRRARPHLFVALTSALVLSLGAVGPVFAQAALPLARALHGDAKAAYDAAKVLLANTDYAGAYTKFEQAYDLSKDPRLLYNMALCEKNKHAYAHMRTLLERYERDADATMSRSDRAAVDAALAAIAGLVGSVKLTVTPEGATVLLDGASVGTSPLAEPLLVDLGKHALTAEKTGFETVNKALDIAGGSELAVELTLVAKKPQGTLVVAAAADATVSIDSSVVGTGRYQSPVPAGLHSVHVTEPNHLPFDAEVDVRDGEVRTLEVTLTAEKQRAIWPWIVGGAAVVVVAAATGGYFAATSSTTTVPPPVGKSGSIQFNSVRFR